MPILFQSLALKQWYHYLCRYNHTIANHLIVLLAFFLPTLERPRTTIIFLLLTLLIFKKDLWSDLKDALQNRVIQAFILFWSVNALLVPFSLDPGFSFSYINDIKFFVLIPLLLFIYLDKAFIPRIISAFILGMLLSELLSYGLIFHFIDHIPYGTHHASAKDPSPFLYHMGYGVILAFTAILLLYNTLTSTKYLQKFFYGLFFITVSINVFMNAGRTGYVIYAIAIMTLLLLMYRKHFFKIILTGSLFLVMVYSLAFTFSPLFQKQMGKAIQSVEKIVTNGDLHSNIGARIAMAQMAIESIKDRPLLGHGPNIAAPVISQKARDLDSPIAYLHNLQFVHIDNQYLETLVSIGILGFLFLINIFVQIIRFKQPDPMLKTIQISLLVLLLAYGVEATFMTDMGFISKLFVVFTTLTLGTRTHLEKLEKLDTKHFLYYVLSAILVFFISINS